MTDHDTVDVGSEPRESWATRIGAGFRRTLNSRRNRVVAGVAVTAVVLASGTGAVYAATQGGSGNYRTAVAEIADVSETLSLSGQLASSSSVGAAFQVGGTVSQVLVALGDTVTAGQELATLDLTDLEAAVTSAQDAVANAEQTLEDDLESQASGTSTTTAASSPSTATSGSTSSSSGSSGSTAGTGAFSDSSSTPGGESTTADDEAREQAISEVAEAQQALLAQYDAATAASGTSSAALAQAQEICAPFLSAQLDDDTQGVEAEADADADAATEPNAESDESAPDSADGETSDDLQTALETAQSQLAECQAAVSASQEAQSTTSAANTALTDAATTLNAKVAALQALLGTGTSTPGGASSESTTGETATITPSTSSGSSAESSSSSSTPSSGSGATGGASAATITAERILADQAAIDLAEAELAIAQQNVTFASLTTPVSGTVVGIALASGDSVSAASDTAVITVQGDGGYIVQATVPLSRIATVAVGQTAEVSLPAFGSTYSGEVASIGVLDVSETSTPSYTVTVSVDAGEDSPRVGATANVEVELSDAVDVLTVPTSAITRSGSTATVRRVVDGELTTSEVTLGAVGSERTEILDGLSAGDAVVLADLDQVITSDDESTSTGLTGIGGSGGEDVMFGGGGFGDGSFPTDGDIPAPPGG